jgi:hypothetical protein
VARLYACRECGIDDLEVEFYRLTGGSYIAQFVKDRKRLKWNVASCDGEESFFDKPISSSVIRIILHELADAAGEGHDSRYHREFERQPAEVIFGVAELPDEFLWILVR